MLLVGVQAIFEIGRRLKWVKENDLAHGEYAKWLETISLSQRTANKFTKIVDELGNSKTSSNLGTDALYLIATMPESERDQPQQLDSEKVKNPDEMAVIPVRQ